MTRLQQVNKILKTIEKCGLRCMYYNGQVREDKYEGTYQPFIIEVVFPVPTEELPPIQ